MSLPVALILILIFIILYIVIIDIFTVLFRLTGLTVEKAKFQVISLFTNAGFTTRESEIITSSPRRRKLAQATMITGHVFSAIIVSLIVSIFTNISTIMEVKEHLTTILIAIAAFIVILIFIKIPFIAKKLQKLLEVMALKSMRKGDKENVITELDNYGKSSIMEVLINVLPKELQDKSLKDTNLKGNYNINLLLIKRKNKVLDVTGNTMLQVDDVLVLFGPEQNIKDLFGSKNKKINEDIIKDTIKRNELSIIDNYGKEAMVEIYLNIVPESLKNKTLAESDIKDKYHINVMMLKRANIVQDINKDTIFMEGDTLILFGHYQTIKELFLITE